MPFPYRVPVGSVFIECEGPDEVLSLVKRLTGEPQCAKASTPAILAEESQSAVWLHWAKYLIYKYDLCEPKTSEDLKENEARDIIEVFLDKLMGHKGAKDGEDA